MKNSRFQKTLFFLFMTCLLSAADNKPNVVSDQITLDVSTLVKLPEKRSAALVLFAITDRDSSVTIGQKKTKYIEALKDMIQDLRDNYYWHHDFPDGIDDAIDKRAVYLAGLQYPASDGTGASNYGILILDYTMQEYEEEITIAAASICERFKAHDIKVVGGKPVLYKDWIKAWDEVAKLKDPNGQFTSKPTPNTLDSMQALP